MNSLSGQIIAVKKIDCSSNFDEQAIRDINEELNILKRLNHKHIILYLGHQRIDKNIFIYLEYMSGGI